MRYILTAVFFSALLFSSNSFSFHPVDGWWYNPDESGRGFNIEIQDDEMFISAFHYRENGEPVWWVANGRYNDNTGQMTGEFLELKNGQCPGCPYNGFPDIVEGAGSPVTLEFDSAITASLNWDGESIPLVRQYWNFSLDEPDSFLFGEFHVTSGALGVYFGQQFYMDDTFVGSDDKEYLSGKIRGASSERVAVGRFYPDRAEYLVLIDSSSSYYQLLYFDMSKDRLEGESEIYEKEDDPDGSGLPFIGHRVASKSYVQSGVGPHSLKSDASSSAANSFLLDQKQALQYEVSQQHAVSSQVSQPDNANKEALTNRLEAVESLEHQLRSLNSNLK